MDQICGIVDVQGFQFKDRFVPREVAIISDSISQCQELNPQMNWRELSEDDQAVVLYSTQSKHGLHYCPFNPQEHCFLYSSKEIGKILSIWYSMVSTLDKPFLGYKNQQIGKILKQLEIPSVNLDSPEYNWPNYDEIQKQYGDTYLCAYHKKPRMPNNRLICAYRKANHLYRYLKETTQKPKVVSMES